MVATILIVREREVNSRHQRRFRDNLRSPPIIVEKRDDENR